MDLEAREQTSLRMQHGNNNNRQQRTGGGETKRTQVESLLIALDSKLHIEKETGKTSNYDCLISILHLTYQNNFINRR